MEYLALFYLAPSSTSSALQLALQGGGGRGGSQGSRSGGGGQGGVRPRWGILSYLVMSSHNYYQWRVVINPLKLITWEGGGFYRELQLFLLGGSILTHKNLCFLTDYLVP